MGQWVALQARKVAAPSATRVAISKEKSAKSSRSRSTGLSSQLVAADGPRPTKVGPGSARKASAGRGQQNSVKLLSADAVQIAVPDLRQTEVLLSAAFDIHALCPEIQRPGSSQLLQTGRHV